MSRIYDALRASDQTEPNRLAQLIDVAPKLPSARPESVPPPAEAPEPFEARPVDSKVDHSKSETAAVHSRVLRASPEAYRTVSLRLPAGVPVFPFDGTDTRAAEQYRMLRTTLMQHPVQPKALAVTSATSGDGKTITAVNLAGIMAIKGESRVLLIDADLRRSSVADVMGIDSDPGLANVLRGGRLEDAIVQIEQVPKLYVLPSGSAVGVNPAELLDSTQFRSLFATLREQFSYIVVDTTPMSAVADFRLVHQVVDGAFLVLRPDHTKRSAFLKALELEPQHEILGTVINACEDWVFWKGQEDYSYYGASGKRSKAKR